MEVATRRRTRSVLVAVALLGSVLWWVVGDQAGASTSEAQLVDPMVSQTGDDVFPLPQPSAGWGFAKYDGVDGESKDANHDSWIEILSIDWGIQQAGGLATGASRRRQAASPQDFVISFEYEKASPKVLEACVQGKVFPELQIELAATFSEVKATYLRYEMKNVRCTAYDVSGSAFNGGPPTVVVGHDFEEIKVTYSEYDNTGSNQGNVEFQWKVEEGEG